MQQSTAGSVANIDWSKRREGLSPDKAIEILTWLAEGFVRKVAAGGQATNTTLYYRFDECIEWMKTGMYQDGGG